MPCQKQDFPSSRIIKKVTAMDKSAYIVGGYIRDLLRGKESLDIDIVTGSDIKKLAATIAKRLNGTIVNFKKAGMIRVVSRGISLDFSEIKDSIHNDLSKRDFTINAIAWSPSEGIIDPFKGIDDIKRGIIRAISVENLKDDPLRLLRAYRFVAEEGYRIDPKTRGMIKRLKKTISITADERITSELFKILISPYYMKALKEVFEDGLLRQIISINSDKLLDNIKSLKRMERFIDSLKGLSLLDSSLTKKEEPRGTYIALDNEYSQGLTYRGLLRLERLLLGSKLDKNRLSLSRAIWKRLKAIEEAFRVYIKRKRSISSRILFDIFYRLKEASVDFAILTGRKKIFLEAQRFLQMEDIIPGEKLAEITGLKGEMIGEVLRELRYLQFTGRNASG